MEILRDCNLISSFHLQHQRGVLDTLKADIITLGADLCHLNWPRSTALTCQNILAQIPVCNLNNDWTEEGFVQREKVDFESASSLYILIVI